MVSERVIELKGTLDRLVATLDFDAEPLPDDRALFDEAIRNFTSGGPDLLHEATVYLWAYYRSIAPEFSPAEREDYGIPEIAENADIWNDVEFYALALPYFSLGRRASEKAEAFLTDHYAIEGPVAARIAAAALTDTKALRDSIAAYEAAGCDELMLFPCDPDPQQVQMPADAIQ